MFFIGIYIVGTKLLAQIATEILFIFAAKNEKIAVKSWNWLQIVS
jgi:hypothetical protein